MSDRYPLMRSLDPYHQRIGYLGALALVGVRGLDYLESLVARYDALLFARVYPEDPRFHELEARVSQNRREALAECTRRPATADPAAILRRTTEPPGWLYAAEFWLHDQCMASSVGGLPREKLHRTVDLARWTHTLLPTIELSETGVLLRHLLEESRGTTDPVLFNPLNPRARPCLPLLYARLLLAAEMLYPFLVMTLVSERKLATRGEHGLLRAASASMRNVVGGSVDPEDILAVRELIEFDESIRRNISTEENYLRPRMEILVDLGLVARKSESPGKRTEFMWRVTDTTRRLAEEWTPLRVAANAIPVYLERAFFGSMSRVYALRTRRVHTADERLLWFARAYQLVGREFGFSPGRTLALLACLLAWEAGLTMEIAELFDAVYAAAHGPWSTYLHFSGGSRFDREFLIRIDRELVRELETVVERLRPREEP